MFVVVVCCCDDQCLFFFVVVCCYLKSRPIIIRDPDIIEYSRKYKLRVNNESHGGILRQSSCPWEMNSPVKNETQRIRSKMFENNFRHTLFSPFFLSLLCYARLPTQNLILSYMHNAIEYKFHQSIFMVGSNVVIARIFCFVFLNPTRVFYNIRTWSF